jgi:hypothetical protein
MAGAGQMSPFQFCAVLHPTSDERKRGDAPKLIVKPDTLLARDEQQASMLAGRLIPEEFIDKIDRVELFIRPF